MTNAPPEAWLRGPVPDVPALLQPVAHALVQAGEEIDSLLADFPDALLWQRPAGVASVGFHLQHIAGVLDRLLTYARGEALSEAQLVQLRGEGRPPAAEDGGSLPTTDVLRRDVQRAIARAIDELRVYPDEALTVSRRVGRAGLPSTTHGLLFHAAEHTMRHLGQLLVTARVLVDEWSRRPSRDAERAG